MPDTVLRADNLTIGYPSITLAARLNFTVSAGSVLAVLGHNGSGKSTLVKSILGLVAPLSGRVSWPMGRAPRIGYLAQLTEFDRRIPMRIRDLAAMGAWQTFSFRSGLTGSARRRVDLALERAGIAEIADAPLHTVSGGQLQRALFARVIAQDAPLIILDEPFAAVDEGTTLQLLELVSEWAGGGRAVVMVIHDLSLALDVCSHALLLGNGRGRFGPVAETLTPEALVEHAYMTRSQADWLFSAAGRHPAPEARPHV